MHFHESCWLACHEPVHAAVVIRHEQSGGFPVVSDHLAASSVPDALVVQLAARQRGLETSTFCSVFLGRTHRIKEGTIAVDRVCAWTLWTVPTCTCSSRWWKGPKRWRCQRGVVPPVAAKVQAVTVLRVTAQNHKLEQVADWGTSCRVSPESDKLGAEQKSRTTFAVDDAVTVSRVQSRAWEGRLTLHGDSRHVSPHPHPVPAPTSSCGNVRQRASLKGLHRSTGEASRASGQGLGHGHRQGQGVPPNALPSSARCRRYCPVLSSLSWIVLERFRDRQSVNHHG